MALKKGTDRRLMLGRLHGLTVWAHIRTPKRKDRGLDRIDLEVSQETHDAERHRVDRSALWRIVFSQTSPFTAKVRFSRRRQT
jgi:hypothetical protein